MPQEAQAITHSQQHLSDIFAHVRCCHLNTAIQKWLLLSSSNKIVQSWARGGACLDLQVPRYHSGLVNFLKCGHIKKQIPLLLCPDWSMLEEIGQISCVHVCMLKHYILIVSWQVSRNCWIL